MQGGYQQSFGTKKGRIQGIWQASSHTNRIYSGKEKGLVVTFCKPYTMEHNVAEAAKLQAQEQAESTLFYPTYGASQKRYKKADKELTCLVADPTGISETPKTMCTLAVVLGKYEGVYNTPKGSLAIKDQIYKR